jgi:hypothetical protein
MAFWLSQHSPRMFAFGNCLANCYNSLAQIFIVRKSKNMFLTQWLENSDHAIARRGFGRNK